jgi:hypothetical protein
VTRTRKETLDYLGTCEQKEAQNDVEIDPEDANGNRETEDISAYHPSEDQGAPRSLAR